jgi:ArsR family transcriptional regulator
MKELEKVLKACADRNRLRILKMLEKKKMCVCELSFVLGITQPSVSRHLKKLRKAGLIGTEQDSFWTNYYVSPDNRYAEEITDLIRGWLKDDEIIKQDKDKVKKADREKLCCKG